MAASSWQGHNMTVIIKSGATDLNVINVLYANVFSQSTVTYSSAAAGYPGANAQDEQTWNSWKPTAVPAYATVDLGAAVMCNCLGIAAHDLGTEDASVALQHSANGSSWTTIVAAYSPTDNEDIQVYFANTSARYWRVVIGDAVASIGVIKLGAALKFPCAPLEGHRPLHHSRKVTMLSNQSAGGNFLGNRPVKLGAETGVNIGMVDRDWAETDLADFETHFNNGGAFFYCGSPSDTPKDMGYCRREGGNEMSITWVEGDIMADVNFEMTAYVAT
jgi:hypothetical protein